VLVAGPLAAASQRWVEDPLRRGRFIGTVTRRNLAMAGALSVAVAVGALGVGSVTTARLGDSAPAAVVSPSGDPLAGLVPTDAPATRLPAASVRPSAAGASPGAATSIPSGAPSAGPVPSGPSGLPPTPDGPVPGNLLPSLADVRADSPRIYADGCHLDTATTVSPPCVYGDPSSSTTVVLFGDSHAAQWFPALEKIAIDRGLRLVSLTKSACTAAYVTVWSATLGRAYTECDTWRKNAIARIATEHPALVVVSDSRAVRPVVNGQQLIGDAGAPAVAAGLAQTLADLAPLAGAVTVIGATPEAPGDPPSCLSAHLDSVLACATPASTAIDVAWIAEEGSVAAGAGATFVDPTLWVCPTGPCPAVIGRYLVYRDTHHLATPFAAALATRLEARLPLPSAPPGASRSPAASAGTP
jgi:hypothetical protein